MATEISVIELLPDGEDVWGSHGRIREVDITMSNSYPAGGYTITPEMFGLTALRGIELLGMNDDAIGYFPIFEISQMPGGTLGGLLIIYNLGTGQEASGDISDVIFRFRVTGE